MEARIRPPVIVAIANVPSVAGDTRQHSYHSILTFLSTPAIYYSKHYYCSHLRPSATLVYRIDCLSAAIQLVLARHQRPSRVPSTHLTNIIHSPSKHLDDSQPLYTSSHSYRITYTRLATAHQPAP
jgi:hypothetical protein